MELSCLVWFFDGRVHVDAQSLFLLRLPVLFEQLWVVQLNPVPVLWAKYRIVQRFNFVYSAIGAFAKFANLFKHWPTEIQLFLSAWAGLVYGCRDFRGLHYETFTFHWMVLKTPQLPSLLMLIISAACLFFVFNGLYGYRFWCDSNLDHFAYFFL